MWKDKMRFLRDYVIKHSKVAFPLIIIVVVAITVTVALKAGNAKAMETKGPESTQASEAVTAAGESSVPVEEKEQVTDAPLELNTNGDLYTLIATYYNALATGDVPTIQSISNFVEDTEEIRILELSKYIESYPFIEIYTKPGPEENSFIAYVYTKVTFIGYTDELPGLQAFYICTDENGKLYLNEGEVSDEILEYIKTVNFQDDVVELNNRVNAECSQLYINNVALFDYINELEKEVSKATGEALAAQVTPPAQEGEDAVPPADQPAEGGDQTQPEAPVEQPPAEPVPTMAQATTTVNVRSSDSEQADKIGKLQGGTQVQVTEQKPNGWTKIVFEGKDGFVKSEFLQAVQADAGAAGGTANTDAVIGTVTATTNINIRSSASETAEKIGVLPGGEAVELISKENGWCKIKYNGQVGFVKEEYVQ